MQALEGPGLGETELFSVTDGKGGPETIQVTAPNCPQNYNIFSNDIKLFKLKER